MKFQVGDRVAAYINGDRTTGFLEKIHENETFEFCADSYSSRRTVHSKQCRKLTKKPRRHVWVDPEYLNAGGGKVHYRLGQGGMVSECHFKCANVPVDGWVEFVEVKK